MAQNVASAPAPQMRHEPAPSSSPERRLPQRNFQRRTYGALDLGTNNCRLLIARPSDGGFTVIDAFSRIVRLGDGLSQTGRLSDEAMDRAVAALSVCADKLRRRNVSLSRSVATEACRRAANGRKFLERVRSETGIALEIIEPAEEARLAMLGCHKLLEPGDGPALIFDIGGGSTELVEGGPDGVVASHSMQVGAVRVTERHLHDDPPSPAQVQAATTMVDAALADATSALAAGGARLADARSLVGVAGTVATVGALHADLAAWDDPAVHGHRVPAAGVSDWARRLLAMPAADRAALAAVPSARADVVAAGALILDRVVGRTGATEVVVSLADNLDGLVATMAPGRPTG